MTFVFVLPVRLKIQKNKQLQKKNLPFNSKHPVDKTSFSSFGLSHNRWDCCQNNSTKIYEIHYTVIVFWYYVHKNPGKKNNIDYPSWRRLKGVFFCFVGFHFEFIIDILVDFRVELYTFLSSKDVCFFEIGVRISTKI